MLEFNNDEYIKKIILELQKIDYIKPDEIPNIDLYMDQVTTFMDDHLKASKRYEEDKLLTKTMINNYTKNNLLPPPDKKKYSKEHMLLLIFIYYFKNILSINDIQNMFHPLTEKFYHNESDVSLEAIYKEVFHLEKEQIDVMTQDVMHKYSKSKDTFSDPKYDKDREFLNRFSFICMLSFDVYVKKTIIERLLDQSSEETFGKTHSETKKSDIKKADIKKPDIKKTDIRKPDVKKVDVRKPDAKKTDARKLDAKKADVNRANVKSQMSKSE